MPSRRRPLEATAAALVSDGTTPWVVAITGLLLTLAAVYVGVAPWYKLPYEDTVARTGLLALLALVLVELLFLQFRNLAQANRIADELASHACVVLPPASVQDSVVAVIESGEARRATVICYGLNLFGNVIALIKEKHHDIDVNLVICSPECRYLPGNPDREHLRAISAELVQARNIHLHHSAVLPTIRGIAVYDARGQAIWCSVQAYHMFPRARALRGDMQTPVIVAQDRHTALMGKLSEYVEEEFSRLAGTVYPTETGHESGLSARGSSAADGTSSDVGQRACEPDSV
jgi:hypothetical protein